MVQQRKFPWRVVPPVLPFSGEEIEKKIGIIGKYIKFHPTEKSSGCFVAVVTREVCLISVQLYLESSWIFSPWWSLKKICWSLLQVLFLFQNYVVLCKILVNQTLEPPLSKNFVIFKFQISFGPLSKQIDATVLDNINDIACSVLHLKYFPWLQKVLCSWKVWRPSIH